jgi:hypothetical protein
MIGTGNIAKVIDRTAVNVTHRAKTGADSYNADGILVPGAVTEVTKKATIQPVAASFAGSVGAGAQLQDVMEGIRASGEWIIWARWEMKVDEQIIHDGKTYRVTHIWPRKEGAFYRALLGEE